MDMTELKQMAAECESELRGHILPFWRNLRDERGGFFGQMTPDLVLHADAPKGVILHARILWAFSSAYLRYREQCDLEAAAHAYAFLKTAWDAENGGFYWSMTADCTPDSTDKYAYSNAFCVYGLSLYAEASGDPEALALAMRAFECIEAHFYQPDGYIETFTGDWQLLENDHLSEHDLHAAKTMNTTLHLIEAYAELYRVSNDERVGEALKKLLLLMADRIYMPEQEILGVFFDAKLNLLGDLYSYGHDIEASWLVDHACDCLGDAEITARWREINLRLAGHVYEAAFHDGALYNECFAGEDDKTRVWWVQAEGVIGFLNAAHSAVILHQDVHTAERYLNAAAALWEYIKAYQIDRRNGGEWHAETDTNGAALTTVDMAGPWKCPYHNSRMCLEAAERIRTMD